MEVGEEGVSLVVPCSLITSLVVPCSLITSQSCRPLFANNQPVLSSLVR